MLPAERPHFVRLLVTRGERLGDLAGWAALNAAVLFPRAPGGKIQGPVIGLGPSTEKIHRSWSATYQD